MHFLQVFGDISHLFGSKEEMNQKVSLNSRFNSIVYSYVRRTDILTEIVRMIYLRLRLLALFVLLDRNVSLLLILLIIPMTIAMVTNQVLLVVLMRLIRYLVVKRDLSEITPIITIPISLLLL